MYTKRERGSTGRVQGECVPRGRKAGTRRVRTSCPEGSKGPRGTGTWSAHRFHPGTQGERCEAGWQGRASLSPPEPRGMVSRPPARTQPQLPTVDASLIYRNEEKKHQENKLLMRADINGMYWYSGAYRFMESIMFPAERHRQQQTLAGRRCVAALSNPHRNNGDFNQDQPTHHPGADIICNKAAQGRSSEESKRLGLGVHDALPVVVPEFLLPLRFNLQFVLRCVCLCRTNKSTVTFFFVPFWY